MVILSYSNPYQSLKFSFQIETINLGKRPLVRRRGRGGNQFRSTSTGKVGKTANYPRFPLAENHVGEIIDLVHERGREAPLSKVRFEDGSISFIPAVLGTKVGESLQFGLKSKIEQGNVISVQNIPDGTIVCNIERHFGDGGAIVRYGNYYYRTLINGNTEYNPEEYLGTKWVRYGVSNKFAMLDLLA